jgi:hypothetical protein
LIHNRGQLWYSFIYCPSPDLGDGIWRQLTHFFTPEEANRALPEVRNLVQQVVELKKSIDRSVDRGRSEEMSKLSLLISKIEERGAELKDADIGLIDFPALRFSEPVYLCWKLGEEEVLFWHGSEGFRGRKPLRPEAAKIV